MCCVKGGCPGSVYINWKDYSDPTEEKKEEERGEQAVIQHLKDIGFDDSDKIKTQRKKIIPIKRKLTSREK